MIRICDNSDFEIIHSIINEAAEAYNGIIPEDRWKDPYMSRDELKHEIDDGVVFWGYEKDDELIMEWIISKSLLSQCRIMILLSQKSNVTSRWN